MNVHCEDGGESRAGQGCALGSRWGSRRLRALDARLLTGWDETPVGIFLSGFAAVSCGVGGNSNGCTETEKEDETP